MNDVKITWHEQSVSRAAREQLNGHRGFVVWFTGLSGCGKSTIANALDHQLHARRIHTVLLDGDNVRHGLNASPEILRKRHADSFADRFGLGFSADDREENIRRIGAVAQLFSAAGLVTLTAFVSPFRRDRDWVRAAVEQDGQSGCPGDFVEVFVDTPLAVCESRDPKGLYIQARAGKIKDFTGIDSPYEPPLSPQLVLPGAEKSPAELAGQVVHYLQSRNLVPSDPDEREPGQA